MIDNPDNGENTNLTYQRVNSIKFISEGGQVRNYSSKDLWVVETDSGSAIAHKLSPGRQSPASVDTDGVKSIDGTPIDGHNSWWKIELDGGGGLIFSDVQNSGSELKLSCGGFCTKQQDGEFGNVAFDNTDNWGTAISS